MPRCPAKTKRTAVRGQLDDKGKPLQVEIHCQGAAGHSGAHFNGMNQSAFTWTGKEA